MFSPFLCIFCSLYFIRNIKQIDYKQLYLLFSDSYDITKSFYYHFNIVLRLSSRLLSWEREKGLILNTVLEVSMTIGGRQQSRKQKGSFERLIPFSYFSFLFVSSAHKKWSLLWVLLGTKLVSRTYGNEALTKEKLIFIFSWNWFIFLVRFLMKRPDFRNRRVVFTYYTVWTA